MSFVQHCFCCLRGLDLHIAQMIDLADAEMFKPFNSMP